MNVFTAKNLLQDMGALDHVRRHIKTPARATGFWGRIMNMVGA